MFWIKWNAPAALFQTIQIEYNRLKKKKKKEKIMEGKTLLKRRSMK